MLLESLDFEKIENIRKLISNKNFFGVGELLDESGLDSGLKEALEKLPQLFGGAEIIDEAEKYAFGPREPRASYQESKLQSTGAPRPGPRGPQTFPLPEMRFS